MRVPSPLERDGLTNLRLAGHGGDDERGEGSEQVRQHPAHQQRAHDVQAPGQWQGKPSRWRPSWTSCVCSGPELHLSDHVLSPHGADVRQQLPLRGLVMVSRVTRAPVALRRPEAGSLRLLPLRLHELHPDAGVDAAMGVAEQLGDQVCRLRTFVPNYCFLNTGPGSVAFSAFSALSLSIVCAWPLIVS